MHLPDGWVIDYYQLTFPEYAMIIACTTEGTILVERPYRHGIGRGFV
jgi:hypothetical protein